MNKIKNKVLAVFVSFGLSLAALLNFLPASAAGTASMYLSPASGSVVKGSTLTVKVYENSGADQTNAVQVNLNYPASKLTYVSHSINSSVFNLEGPQSTSSGLVKFMALRTSSGISGTQLVFTVNFKAAASSGTATISFANGSQVVDYNSGQPMTLTTTGGSYALKAPASSSPSPATSSSTSSGSSSSTSTPSTSSSSHSSASSSSSSTTKKKPSSGSATTPSQPTTGSLNNNKSQESQAAAKKGGFKLSEDWPWLVAAAGLVVVIAAFIIWPFSRTRIQPSANSQISMPAQPGEPSAITPPAAGPLEGIKRFLSGALKPGTHASLVVYLVVFAGIGGYITWRIFAAAPNPPSVYLQALNPSTTSLAVNQTFTVQVRENSGSTAVNAVQANFSYPSTLVDFVSIDSTGSAFDVEAQSTGGSGQVSIARGKTSTSVTNDQLVATVTFKAKTTGGSVPMAFTSGTALVGYDTNQDILGGLGNTGGLTYTIDTTAPIVSVTAPSNGATVALGSTTTISATASDASSAISKVEFYVDGALKSSDTTSPYSYSWNTSGLSPGSHTLQAKATDAAGNVGSSSTVSVTIADQTAPSAPTNLRATSVTQNSVALAWNASTDNVGVTGYRVSRGGSTLTTTSALAYTNTGLSTGTNYSYYVVALDAAGNASTAATLSVTTQSAKVGDITGDGKVDILDFSRLVAKWNTTNASSGWDATCDLNSDSKVDILDFSTLVKNWDG